MIADLTIELKKRRGHVVASRQSSLAVARQNTNIVSEMITFEQSRLLKGYLPITAYLNYNDGLSADTRTSAIGETSPAP